MSTRQYYVKKLHWFYKAGGVLYGEVVLSRAGTEMAASSPLPSKMLKMFSSNVVSVHSTVFNRADDTDVDKIAGTFLLKKERHTVVTEIS